MRSHPLVLLSFPLLLLAAPRAGAEPYNAGAAIALHDLGVRVPACVVPQPDSGALVVFLDTRNNVAEVYAQRVDRRGRPQLGAGGSLIWTALGGTFIDSFSPDGSGGCVFAWSQNRGASGRDVMVQRVLADGSAAYGASGLVVCNAPRDQRNAQLAPGPAGSYWVAWSDDRANVAGERDVYAQRLNLAGAPQLAVNGAVVNTAAFRAAEFYTPVVTADLTGGVLVSWNVVNTSALRAQRMNSTGALLYGATGAPLADPTDAYASIVADGTGGLWAATIRSSGSGSDVFAHHLTAAGASSFTPTGVLYHNNPYGGCGVYPVRNASGGCFFFTVDYFSGGSSTYSLYRHEVDVAGNLLRGLEGERLTSSNTQVFLFDAGSCVLLATYDVYIGVEKLCRLQRFAYDGTPTYPGNGIVLGRHEGTVQEIAVAAAATPSGLVFEAHADGRFVGARDPGLYEVFGQAYTTASVPLWDDAENPVLAGAQDAPGDQGGGVRVTWDAGVGDSPLIRSVRGYRGWRALGAAKASALAAKHPAADTPFEADGRWYVLQANLYWEMVAEVAATQLPTYALTLATGQDSTSAGSADESFMIEAYDDSLHHWWSGSKVAHSVDNLAPAAPAPFTGTYAAGTTQLHWNPNAESDLAGYRLYRGNSPSFTPGPANRIASPTDIHWSDAFGSPAVYKLSAVDVHGNESGVTTLVPDGTVSLDEPLPRVLALSLISPNPSRGTSTLRLDLPSAARVRLAIFDAGGRRVRSLVEGERPAGMWSIPWDGADDAGHAVSSGVYFAKLETAGGGARLRIVRLQ